MTYPATPGFQSHSRTSQLAAESITVESMENFIISNLHHCGAYGATADELQQLVMMKWPKVQAGTIAARLRGIELKEWAVKLTETRLTRAGKAAHVWVHKPYIQGRTLAPTVESDRAATALEVSQQKEITNLQLRLECALISVEAHEKKVANLLDVTKEWSISRATGNSDLEHEKARALWKVINSMKVAV